MSAHTPVVGAAEDARQLGTIDMDDLNSGNINLDDVFR